MNDMRKWFEICEVETTIIGSRTVQYFTPLEFESWDDDFQKKENDPNHFSTLQEAEDFIAEGRFGCLRMSDLTIVPKYRRK